MFSVLQYIEADKPGGVTRHVALLTRGLRASRFRVTLMCPNSDELLEFGQGLERDGVRVIWMPDKYLLRRGMIQRIADVRKAIVQCNADIVHIHRQHISSGRAALIAAKLARISAITTEHFPLLTFFRLKSPLLRRIKLGYVRAAKRAEAALYERVVAVSEANAKYLAKTIGVPEQKIRRIYNGIDLASFGGKKDKSKAFERLSIQGNHRVVCCIAALAKQKGHLYLINAVTSVIHKKPKTIFLIIGDGPLRSELEERCKKLGISKNVIFLGYRNDVPDILSCVDLFVLPSLFEPFGLVLVEAMASGIPVVATNVDGISEIIEDGVTGLLVRPRDEEQLSEAILTCLDNKHKAMELGNRGKIASSKFSAEQMVHQTKKLYREVFLGKERKTECEAYAGRGSQV